MGRNNQQDDRQRTWTSHPVICLSMEKKAVVACQVVYVHRQLLAIQLASGSWNVTQLATRVGSSFQVVSHGHVLPICTSSIYLSCMVKNSCLCNSFTTTTMTFGFLAMDDVSTYNTRKIQLQLSPLFYSDQTDTIHFSVVNQYRVGRDSFSFINNLSRGSFSFR